VLGEALFNHLGAGRVKAYSAGSTPIGRTNVNAVKILQKHGVNTEGFNSQSWNEYADHNIDIAITVCDNAANEECPVYLNSVVRAHWGLSDPAHLKGTDDEIDAAFEKTYAAMERRVKAMLVLPFEEFNTQELTEELNKIGKIDD
jgi:arsenate reductase